jgi:hypothetical protein
MTLDEAVDHLYGVPLDEFVAERSRLAKALDGDDAKAVAKLRKPTAAAWILNQLARQSRRDVDLLLDAGHRLREAQAGVLRGADRDTFERARKQESDALKRLSREAAALGASSSALGQIEQSLRAAAVSEDGRELLARGRFVKPLEAGLGFDAVAALAGDVKPRPRVSKADDRRRAQDALREARSALRDAEASARDSVREVERLRAELRRAETAADEAQARVDAADRKVERARRALGGETD